MTILINVRIDRILAPTGPMPGKSKSREDRKGVEFSVYLCSINNLLTQPRLSILNNHSESHVSRSNFVYRFVHTCHGHSFDNRKRLLMSRDKFQHFSCIVATANQASSKHKLYQEPSMRQTFWLEILKCYVLITSRLVVVIDTVHYLFCNERTKNI